MARLIDIKGYWNQNDEYIFNDTDMWEGKLLLEDDGWFEGIVTDPYSQYTGDRFIFGIYHPTKIIELFKVSPSIVSDPFVFRGRRDAKGYDGEFSIIGLLSEHKYGVSHLITQDVDYLKENNYQEVASRNIDTEKEELLNRIELFKNNNTFSYLYENTKGMRSNLSQYVLRKYYGERFTKEQIESFLEPVSDKVKETANSAVLKLYLLSRLSYYYDDDIGFPLQ